MVLTGDPEQLMLRMDNLADPTRLRLLRLLERRELGVAELVEILQLPQSTVSRHLKILADQGWVASRSQGTMNLYRMTPSDLEPSARALWKVARRETGEWATARQDDLRLDHHLSNGGRRAEEFFAGAAAHWDKLRREQYGDRYGVIGLLALLPASDVVADLGCGTGSALADLAGHVKRVIGVDSSTEMLKAARQRTREMSNVELYRAPLESLPIRDGECDAATMFLALSYVADPTRALAEMARILRPGGRAVVVDLMSHDREAFRIEMGQRHLGFEPAALESLAEEAGLEGVTTRPLVPEPGAQGPALVMLTGRQAAPVRTIHAEAIEERT
ncbi:MAG: metalloregulator ArsR/SmtB family transcription factor [Acidobacteria bacterium]|nr:metalloregulator ArsR/SmtB family transcription factor [Acidobacteriota bacterium]